MTSTSASRIGSGYANDVVLKRLGSVTVLAARIECLGAEIARDVKLDPNDGFLRRLREGEFTTPPWATTTTKDLMAWSLSASRLLWTRTSIFTAAGEARFSGSRGDTIATPSIDGSIFPADEEYLTRLLTKLERHLAAGVQLREGLGYRDEQGQNWPLVSIYRRSQEHEPSGEPTLRLPVEWQNWLSA